MKKKLIIVAVGALVVFGLLLSSGALAGRGNEMPSGNHYNLNIIGVDDKENVGDSMGHTMFVDLNGTTKIIMFQDRENAEFKVVDRNGLDDGEANFSIGPGHYDVYARALGKPGGKVNITAKGEFVDDEGYKLIKLGSVDISRLTGKPKTRDINKLFYVDVTLQVGGEKVVYKNEWVFDIPELLGYYWEYKNTNLKLLQVRFYPRAE